jgi:type I restriction enzyme S subunit
LAEQRRIVAEVERRLSVAQEIGSVVTGCLERASRLRQAILKQAFEGRLVAQNSEDEPAETPLETIIKEEKKKVDEVYQQARLF